MKNGSLGEITFDILVAENADRERINDITVSWNYVCASGDDNDDDDDDDDDGNDNDDDEDILVINLHARYNVYVLFKEG